MKRIFLKISMLLIGLSTIFPNASAAAMPWQWSDISTHVTERRARPVWAMAHANGNWYYTDGWDLWNGGQVYRFDGTTLVNITNDIRSTGVTRVDDIVTDGTNVLFFKNIFRLDNAVEAVMYRNGSYTNVTNILREPLDANEGISSIVGRNGAWIAVTTRARFIRFSENMSSWSRITPPPGLKTLATSDVNLLYSKHHRMDRHSAGIVLAPAGNSILLGVSGGFFDRLTAQVLYYKLDGQRFDQIPNPSSDSFGISGIAFNANIATIFANVAGNRFGTIFTYDGSSWNRLDNWYGTTGGSFDHFKEKSNFSAVWDGSHWMILSGKKLFRLAGNSLEEVTLTRDYFVTVASNGAGTTLFGGVASTDALSGPQFPLNAKLVKAATVGSASGGIQTPTPSTTVKRHGISAWQWFAPNLAVLNRNQHTTYAIGMQHAEGLKRAEIVVNGVVRKTCELNQTKLNQHCEFTIHANDYPAGTNVAVNARIIGRSGDWQELWTPLTNVFVQHASISTPGEASNGAGPMTWSWSHQTDSRLSTRPATYNVGAWDGVDGMSRIEIWVNGSVRNTCNYPLIKGNVECSWTIHPVDYANGSSVFVNARAVDAAGNVTWAASKTWQIER